MIKFPRPMEKILPNEIPFSPPPPSHVPDEKLPRIIGSLIGLSVCDALGASVEFRPREYLVDHPVRKMEGGGTWGLDAGKWTDDTSMALCLASSLITMNGFNLYDQMVRYKWWFKYGYLSSTGNCFDIGKATRQSLIDFSNNQKLLKIHYHCRNEYEIDTLTWDSVQRIQQFQINYGNKESAGNGALMRLAPVPLFYHHRPDLAVEYAGRSAQLTHDNEKAIDACRYYAALIVAALHGLNKDQILHEDFYSTHRDWFGEIPLSDEILSVAKGSFKRINGYDDGIRGKGYVVQALEAALWAFWSDENSFEKGALSAVNLGDDTDTTAAIYGQLAGAYYGYERIPKEWIKTLYAHDFILSIGQWLHFQGQSDHKVNSHQSRSTEKVVYKKQSSNPKIAKTVSLDSSSPIPRVSIPKFKVNYETTDDYTTTTHEYPFYRENDNDEN